MFQLLPRRPVKPRPQRRRSARVFRKTSSNYCLAKERLGILGETKNVKMLIALCIPVGLTAGHTSHQRQEKHAHALHKTGVLQSPNPMNLWQSLPQHPISLTHLHSSPKPCCVKIVACWPLHRFGQPHESQIPHNASCNCVRAWLMSMLGEDACLPRYDALHLFL